MSYSDWRQRSARHIWHPYTDMSAFETADFPVIERAEGSTLYDIEGRALLDGISSWWCVNLGHSHPRLVRAIQEQVGQLQHTLLGGMSHPRAIELAERLAHIVPEGLGHAMFAADGTMAVEAALKIALQYWVHRGEPQRTRFIALEDGYHGDSLAAVGIGYIDRFHRPFRAALQPALTATAPRCARCPHACQPETCDAPCFAGMQTLVHAHHAECAAVIVEPLCQGAAGMRIYSPAYLRRLSALCREYGLLLIADEIAVGFGRTGAMFACGLAGIRPDILCLGKGLTGGMLPMSATMVTDAVFEEFQSKNGESRTLYHGTTFCGNPITSAVALAALDVYEEENILGRAQKSAVTLRNGMASVAALLDDSPLSSLGMIASIEIKASAGGAARAVRMVQQAYQRGLFIRPLGDTIYLWPPLNIRESDLQQMVDILTEAAQS